MNYVDILRLKYPSVVLTSVGTGEVYEDLQWSIFNPQGPLSKAQLDQDIQDATSGVVTYVQLELSEAEVSSSDIAGLADAATKVLSNKMPAYREPTNSVLTSVASSMYNFGLKSGGTKKVYLSIVNDISSNIVGYLMPRNALLKGVTLMRSTTAGNASFEVRLNGLSTPEVSYVIPAYSTNAYFVNLSVPLSAGDEVAIYLNCTNNVGNPTCVLEIGWRN